MNKLFDKLFQSSVPREQAIAAYDKMLALFAAKDRKVLLLCDQLSYQHLKADFKSLKKVTKITRKHR